MAAKKPDDIMAEYLLKGGKMLSKACKACGSPLFEVKGETLCVVCREAGKEKGKGTGKGTHGTGAPAVTPETTTQQAVTPGGPEEERELRETIATLARRAREEADPERCLALLSAAREAAEALSLLHL